MRGVGAVLLLGVTLLSVARADGPSAEATTGPTIDPALLHLPEDATAAAYLLSRRTSEELVALMRSPRIDAKQTVCDELLKRPDVGSDVRREVIDRLAKMKGESPESVLVSSLYSIDRVSGIDPVVVEELGEMLIGGNREALEPRLSTVLRIAKYGRNDVTKECGWAAYVRIRADPPAALQYARSSTSRLTWMLRGLRRVRETELLTVLRADVREIATTHDDAKVRAAAYVGLVSCDPSIETADFLIGLVNEPPEGFAALAGLEEFPPDRFPATRIAAHVRALVVFTKRQTPERQVLIANRVRGSWAHAAALVARLPEGVERKRLRAALESIAVRTVVLRTVRQEMRFDRNLIEVEAGRVVEIRYENPDDLPQNLVVIAPGSIERVGAAADAMTGREAFDKGFVPDLPEVHAALPIVQPHSTGTLVFVAPREPGDHHFVSTIAEHWRNMQGTLRVVSPTGG